MRRILLSCVCAATLMLPAAASGRASTHHSQAGYLVIHKGVGNGGVTGDPVVTVVVKQGFVLGRISGTQVAQVEIYHLPSVHRQGKSGVKGVDVSGTPKLWHGLPGTEYNGIGFRFRAIGGFYRVVVRGSGVYLFAGGHGNVRLRGSSFDPSGDGTYALNGGRPRSLPTQLLKRKLGGG